MHSTGTFSEGSKTEEIILLDNITVGAGADSVASVDLDLSMAKKVQFIYLTTSSGTATTNSLVYSVNDSSYKESLKGAMPSVSGGYRHVVSPTDILGLKKVKVYLRSAEAIMSITVTLKVYIQF